MNKASFNANEPPTFPYKAHGKSVCCSYGRGKYVVRVAMASGGISDAGLQSDPSDSPCSSHIFFSCNHCCSGKQFRGKTDPVLFIARPWGLPSSHCQG